MSDTYSCPSHSLIRTLYLETWSHNHTEIYEYMHTLIHNPVAVLKAGYLNASIILTLTFVCISLQLHRLLITAHSWTCVLLACVVILPFPLQYGCELCTYIFSHYIRYSCLDYLPHRILRNSYNGFSLNFYRYIVITVIPKYIRIIMLL